MSAGRAVTTLPAVLKLRSALLQVVRCALLLYCCHAPAQTRSNALHQSPSIGPSQSDEPWAISASVYAYFPPETGSYLQPTLTADHDWLHLEARYNYEELDTGSAWIGYNFSGGGEEVQWEFSPLLGAVFGKLTGVAPGYRGLLSWRKIELSTEGEYVIDTADSSASYFYNWSELSLGLLERFRIGVAVQHTRAYQTDRDVQRGVLAGFSYKNAQLTGYVFNPDDHKPTVVMALSMSW
jgi:hypothetical protein